nr:hypothetical protein [Tanacetum cinerariifolium]
DPSLPPLNQGNYLPEVRNELKIFEAKSEKSSIVEPPEVELKDLPPYLEYAFLEGHDKFPVIIAKDLSVEEKTALITGGFTVVENEDNELIPTRLVMGWRVWSMLEKHQLTGPNFNEWFHALKLVVHTEKLHDVFETALPPAPAAGADAQALADWVGLFYHHNEVACLMLGTMSSKLYQQFEHNSPPEMKSIKRNKQPIVGASSTPQVMAIQGGRVQKYKPQGKAKGKGKAELMKKKKKTGGQNVASTSSSIYTIELFAFPKNSWVYDTGYGTHICNIKQGLRGAKKLKRGSLYLYVGNGVRAEVEAIGSFDLVLLNGLIIILDNCHNAPSITRGVVSVSRLVDKGFTQCFTNFGLSVSMNNMLYFNAITVNGIYEIDMRDFTLPISYSMYSVSNKITKSNLDSTYLWHCRLAHINKKRIEKLQHDGLLKSTDNEPFDQCVSCISGKMTRISCSHKTEKVKYVLGLIHTDVFKSEVENQLEKTIKAIRSDHGGEYINQEFKDYLKACGIVQQLTPPYTPQHNGVSERRNRTLLNMVRSMMSLATLPLSFWDYAIESAARILNMVPTKKVDKTSYELWHRKVPNLSYLKVWGYEARMKCHTPDKLQQRSVKCIFVGYPKETMGYYFYYPPENKIVVERYVDFLEKDFILQK